MYINRLSERILDQYKNQFPIIGIMGPRQSGKTSLLKEYFQTGYEFVSFDEAQKVQEFRADPFQFIAGCSQKVVFDDAHKVPELLPVLQQLVNQQPSVCGRFVLAGFGAFLLTKTAKECLAGCIGLLHLLPLQYAEMPDHLQSDMAFRGGYPAMVAAGYTDSRAWFNAYLNSFLQNEVKQALKIVNLAEFGAFIKLLALSATQTMDLSSVSRKIGVSIPMLSKWLSLLEDSYLVFRLNPYYDDQGKQLIKSPKVYFHDNGLLAHLLQINSRAQLDGGVLYDVLFENFVVSEYLKRNYHDAIGADVYYFRTKQGERVDLIIEKGGKKTLVEIKASETYNAGFYQTMSRFLKDESEKQLVYSGKTCRISENTQALSFHDFLISEK